MDNSFKDFRPRPGLYQAGLSGQPRSIVVGDFKPCSGGRPRSGMRIDSLPSQESNVPPVSMQRQTGRQTPYRNRRHIAAT